MRKLFAVAAMLLLATTVFGGDPDYREVILFNGSNTSAAVDTVEQASPWFYVLGASRVDIRIWSANTSAWTAADSVYADSIITWKILFSDSISNTSPGFYGTRQEPAAADSIMIDAAVTIPDTASVGVGCKPLPINKPIAAAKTGSGIISTIYPVKPPMTTAVSQVIPQDEAGVFPKQWMRIRWQPLRRMTEGGRLSTAGIRTQGIRGLKMRARIFYAQGKQ